ncbi:MAG: cobalamin B12-binding domain-containing protein [Phycisphaerales bacterium]|nr:cobalamin B12-binding domain-containing protein [Phycisphaerales bacterium]
MNTQAMVERLFPMLITGDRNGARNTVHDWTEGGLAAETLTQEVYWPLLDMVNDLFRRDQLTTLAHHYATRLLRSLVDQAQACYDQADRNNRSLMLFCGDTEADDLAAQMVADLAEAGGYTVTFGGGGIAYDELLAAVQNQQPDVLLMFSSSASDAPNIRRLIDTIREVGACPNTQIAVGGGVFNRAEGLAEEIGADIWSDTPDGMIHCMNSQPDRRATPEQRTVGQARSAA